MNRDAQERVAFLRSFLAHPRQVGAILPTSRRAVRAMLDLTDLAAATCVVELGAGTGVYTEEILARLNPTARLLAFEIDADLAGTISARLSDDRLHVIADSAEKLDSYLAGTPADVVVSAIPFTSLPAGVGQRILAAAAEALAPAGVLLVLQYSPLVRPKLRRLFESVTVRLCLPNVPPAFLFACEKPRVADPQATL